MSWTQAPARRPASRIARPFPALAALCGLALTVAAAAQAPRLRPRPVWAARALTRWRDH